MNEFPRIYPRVLFVGASELRSLNCAKLRNLTNVLVIAGNGKALAVLLGYQQYMAMQNLVRELEEALDSRPAEGEVSIPSGRP